MPLWDLEPKSKLIGLDSHQSQWKALIEICQDLNSHKFRERKWNQMQGRDFCQLHVPEGGHLKLVTPVALSDY